ncbi:hypothetical protein SRABI118_04588 [Massilia sp. Bi118]|nr:hypothetical protein SRABI118_04588 [Massilia sp. Bi118]
MVACDMKLARPTEPASSQSITRKLVAPGALAAAAARRCCAARLAPAPDALAAACSISAAAACTCWIVEGWPSEACVISLVTLWVSEGSSSMMLKNSPCTRWMVSAMPARIAAETRVAPIARLMCQRSSQRTTGLRV